MACSTCPTELRFIMIGKTGTGKSNTANTILQKKLFKAASGGSSVTKKCQLRDAEVFGRSISIVDTPGIYDTNTDESESLKEIVRSIAMIAPGPHAILFVLQVGRCTKEDIDTMTKFLAHFGEQLQNYIIPIFTRYDDWKRDTDDNFENYIDTLPSSAKKFIKETCKERYIAFDNTLTGNSSERQVRMLIQTVDEMVIRNSGEYYSDDYIREAQRIINKKQEEVLQNLRQLEEQRVKERDRQIEKQLEEERNKWKEELDAYEKEYRRKTDELLQHQREIFSNEMKRICSPSESGGLLNTMIDGLQFVSGVTNTIGDFLSVMDGVQIQVPQNQTLSFDRPLLYSCQENPNYLHCGQYHLFNYGNILQNAPIERYTKSTS